MGITFRNQHGTVFYLCSLVDDGGECVYFFVEQITGMPTDSLPESLVVYEDDCGHPEIRTARKQSSLNKSQLESVEQPLPGVERCPFCGRNIPVASFLPHVQYRHPGTIIPSDSVADDLATVGEDRLTQQVNRLHASTGIVARETETPQIPPPRVTTRRPIPTNDGQVKCSRCYLTMPTAEFRDHIQSGRCDEQAEAIGHPAARPAARSKYAVPYVKPPSWVVDVEPFECGICYKPIYRVWTKRGTYRYYNDRELTERHRCSWHVKWTPDHR